MKKRRNKRVKREKEDGKGVLRKCKEQRERERVNEKKTYRSLKPYNKG